MPPMKANAPCSKKFALQKCWVLANSSVFIIKKILLPNISIISPNCATPALMASAAASIVPV